LLDKVDIYKFLETLPDYFVSEVIIRSSDDSLVLYVPNEKISEKSEKDFVTKRQLDNLAKKLSEKFGASTEIIYVNSEKLTQIAEGVELLLKTKYGKSIDEVAFTFLNAKRVNAWLKIRSSHEQKKNSIKEFLSSVFKDTGVDNVDFHWVDMHEKLPTLIELLVLTKTIQPADLDNYLLKVRESYEYIDRTWLNKQLDKLIKKGLVVRDRSSKTYSLTGKGLGVIPSSYSRTSSDIARALDLGRKKW